jgi:uncharacterized membrane protein HdeD (DUF308 family)
MRLMPANPGLSSGALIIRGLLLIVLGVLAFVFPGPTLAALIAVLAAVALVDGVLAVIAGFMAPGGARWWIVLAGVAAIVIGVLTFVSPGSTAIAIVLFVGAWSIVIGVGQVVTGWTLRNAIEGEWLYIASGVVSIVFGAFLLIAPGDGVLALLWLIALYAIAIGIVHLYIGWLMRKRMQAAPAMP